MSPVTERGKKKKKKCTRVKREAAEGVAEDSSRLKNDDNPDGGDAEIRERDGDV